MDTPYGVIVTADDVCQAVQATLEAWMPVFLLALGSAEIVLDPPHNHDQLPDAEGLENADLPAGGIFSPGFADDPERDDEGSYRAAWEVSVLYRLRGGTYQETQRNARLYAAAARMSLLSQQTLLGFANGVRLIDEGYRPVGSGARTLGEALVTVAVTVDDAWNDLAVPDGLPPDPIPPVGVVTQVDVDVLPED